MRVAKDGTGSLVDRDTRRRRRSNNKTDEENRFLFLFQEKPILNTKGRVHMDGPPPATCPPFFLVFFTKETATTH